MATYSPLEGDNWGECVIQQGHPAPRPGEHCGSTWDRVSAHFLDAIGVPMVRGRGFTEQDTATSPQVVVVNQAFRETFLSQPGSHRQHFGIDDVKYSGSWEIVGVFADFKLNNPREEVHRSSAAAGAALHRLQGTDDGLRRNAVDVYQLHGAELQHAAAECRCADPSDAGRVDPNLTVMDLRTLDSQVAGNFNQDRLVAQLSSLFGILSLILASVGLYGVMSYFVARRTSEIGIRMALGATRASVVTW
jgi:hypothetical protein